MGFEEMRGYLTDAAAAERACSPSWAAALENEVDLLCWSIAGSYDFGDDYTARRGIARMAVMCAAVERSGPAAARAALESHVRECCDRALPPDAAEGACAWEAIQRIVADQPGTYLGAGLFESAVGALRSSALGDAPRAARHIESWLGIGAGEMLGIVESRLDGDPGAARLSESWGREVYESLFARDLEREAHVQRTAYSLELACEAEGGLRISFSFSPPAEQLEDGTRCFDRGYLEGIAERFGGAVFEADFSVSERKSAPPLPYSMDTLVADMSARFKMTATEVMEATQKLRDDHHAITYNRSPVPYLKEEHFNLAPTTSATVQMCLGTSFELAFERKTSAFDDSKCGAHHGIIPQDVLLDVRSLPEREALVYEAVAMRYLAQFMGAQAYSEATAAVSIEGLGGTLKHSSKVLGEPGWTALCPSRWAKVSRFEERIPDAGAARVRVIESSISEKKTEPPKAFTDGTLVSAMSRISRYVGDPETRRILEEKDSDSPGEHGSIGTVATRAQIVESLVSRGYLERKKASLVSTDKGRAFIELLPPDLAGVDLTARWYLLQKKVEAGELPPSCVMEDVCERFEERRDRAYEGKTLVPAAGPCPVCGGSVVSRGRAWSCSSNVEERDENGSFRLVSGCGFKILPFCGKELSEKQAAALIEGKRVAMKGCVSKSGSKFDCKLALDPRSHTVKPLFDQRGPVRTK